MDSNKFTHEQLKRRKCNLIARIIYEVLEEGIYAPHTRIPEMIIWDAWAMIGRSSKQSTYREHVVPLAFLRNTSIEMYKAGKTLNDVEQFWFDHYLIALITNKEADRLNAIKGLKTGMPKAWKMGDDPRERLWKAEIVLISNNSIKLTG